MSEVEATIKRSETSSTGEDISVAIEVELVEKYCKGCGLCVAVCPHGVIYMKETVNEKGVNAAGVKNDGACKGCMNCVLVCPEACIAIRKLEAAAAEAKSSKTR
jgi:2-oxoglutarate ferredoxin oxidoreductase subunit delta